MIRKKIIKGVMGVLLLSVLTPLNMLILTSCSDEPDSEHYYTFTGDISRTVLSIVSSLRLSKELA